MVIQVGDQIEQELRRLAGHQGRALADVVEAALRPDEEARKKLDYAEHAPAIEAALAKLKELTR